MNFLSLTHNRLLILLMIGLTLSINNAIADPGGIGSQILSSYSGSYALLIGESQYTNGWSNLESIPGELREVEKVLQSQGFKVEMSFNLNAEEFTKRFNRFINQYGFDENNRLLFFYSGHGYTRKGKGYIVPVDAANPNFEERAFLKKAVGMNQITTWVRKIEAKHVLFLFDSCFSGSVFKAKDLPKIPAQISQAAALPVRQFITAGSANETVPAQSVFALVFVDALRYGFGDTNKDGYVTGQELGLYLWNKVPQHTEQTPQYGKIQDYKLSRGDFVFVVGSGVTVVVIPPASTTMPVPKPDSDRDGVNDDQDKCPRNTPLEISKGIDSRGCPLDSDWDGVADYEVKLKAERRELAQKLRECENHFQANRLTTGQGGTALACYQAVLKKKPNNTQALSGLNNIEARYVTWIKRSLNKKQRNKAKQYLASLRKVNPDSPKLAEFETQIQSISLCNASNMIRKVNASSILKSQTYKRQKRTYNPWNVVDGDKSTAWVEGVRGNGINQWVKVIFDCKVKIGKISMIAGYTADRYRFEINNRVKRIRVSFSDGSQTTENLEDTMHPQFIDIGYIPYMTQWVKFEIIDIYLGSKYRDTAISEIYFKIDEFLGNE